MADGTKIEWTDATVNAVNGCSVVSPGCTNCYAMRLAGTRLRNHPSRAGLTIDTKAGPVWNGEILVSYRAMIEPLRWRRPRDIFWNAHGDLFHVNVPDEVVDDCFTVMALTPQHRHQVLTKRTDRMADYFDRAQADKHIGRVARLCASMARLEANGAPELGGARFLAWPLPNVWIGTSVEDQTRADERLPHLRRVPAAVKFISAEPLLGDLDLQPHGLFDGEINWVIVGGESGPKARPMHPAWARSLRDQCAAAGVPFFFKQWGEWRHAPDRAHFKELIREPWRRVDAALNGVRPAFMVREGKKLAGRLIDGVQHDGMPA